MKIAFISTILEFPWGGADTLWTRAAEAASDRGDRLLLSISTAVAGNPRIEALIGAGAKAYIRDSTGSTPRPGMRVLRKLGLSKSPDHGLISELKSFRPDLVVFSHGGTYDLLLHPDLTAWLRASGVRYRIIANWQQEHPHLDDGNLAFIQHAFVSADLICFVSTRNLEITRRHLALPLPNAEVIHNPLRWQSSDTSPWPQDAVTHLATVSRLDEGKGIELLLQALSRCGTHLPDWKLNIHGLGPQEGRLREAAAQAGFGSRVEFRGYVKCLRDIWSENHLMVSPAIEDGVPMTIPEAMLCQRPVLATRVGGAEDWIQHGETGFLCTAPGVEALADAVKAAFASRDRWQAMGRIAAEVAIKHYRPNDYLRLINS